jgi:hypothetical protein
VRRRNQHEADLGRIHLLQHGQEHAVFRSVREISREDANMFIAEYVAGLEGYTYLEGEAAR